MGTLLYKHVSQVIYKKIKTKQKRFVASVTCLWEKNEIVSSSLYFKKTNLRYSLLFRSNYRKIGDGFRKSISIQEIKNFMRCL